jgi:L-asparaginase II
VADVDGTVLVALGDAAHPTYVRSAAKPFQAVATLSLLAEAAGELDRDGLAIASASHVGTDEQQVEAARLLALAGLDERALATPPALPTHVPTLRTQDEPTPLAHNCSGKHAAFLYAVAATGGDMRGYLDVDSPLQQRARDALAAVCDAVPAGPGTDGCGAPAWLLALSGLATGFARLAAGTDPLLARVRSAMTARPDLVGGPACADTALMLADHRVVAKRGAEAVFAAGFSAPRGALGVAVKIDDGANRAAPVAVAAVLAALGAIVPPAVARPVVLGGGVPHGAVEVAEALVHSCAELGV